MDEQATFEVDRLVQEGDAASISRALTAPLPRRDRERLIRRLVELELDAGRLERLPGLLLQLPLEQPEGQDLLAQLRTRLAPKQARTALGLAALMEPAAPQGNGQKATRGLPADPRVAALAAEAAEAGPRDPEEAVKLYLRAADICRLRGGDAADARRAELLRHAAALCPARSRSGVTEQLVASLDDAGLLPGHRPLLTQIGAAERSSLRRRDLLGMLVRASRRDDQPLADLERAMAARWYAPASDRSWPAEWLALDPQSPRHRARLLLAMLPDTEGTARTDLLSDLLSLRAHLPGGEELERDLRRQLMEAAPGHPDALPARQTEAAEVAPPTGERAEALRQDGDAGALAAQLQLDLSRTLSWEDRLPLLLELDELYAGPLDAPAEGAARLEMALQLSPTDSDIMDSLARRYRQLGWWEQLQRLLLRHAELEGLDLASRCELLLEAAQVLQEHLDDEERALALADQVLQADPTHREAADLVQALCDTLDHGDERAARLAERVAASDNPSELMRLHLQLARLQLRPDGDAEQASEHLGEAMRYSTDGQEVLAVVRQLLEDRSRLELAEQLLVQVSGYAELPASTRAEAMSEVGRIHEQELQDPEGAAEAYRMALELSTTCQPALAALRVRAASAARWEEAEAYARRELDLLSDPAERLPLLLEVGQIYHLFLGHPDRAQAALDEALEIDEENRAATNMLAELHFQQGHWAEAVVHTARQLSRTTDPERQHEPFFRLAFAQERRGDRRAALENYTKAVHAKPNYLPALERLADLYYDSRRWDDASAAAGTVLEQHAERKSPREQAELWLRIGLCELHVAQREVATERLRDLVVAGDGPGRFAPKALMEVANFWAARELDPRLVPRIGVDARQSVQRAAERCLELHPGHPDAHQLLAAMAVVARDWPTALEQMEKAADCEELPTVQRAQIWSFAGEVAMRQKLAPLLAQSCFNKSLALCPEQPEVARKVEILSRSTLQDEKLGIPPQWERQGVTSRLDWVTRPPTQEVEATEEFENRDTIPYDPVDRE